MILLKPLQAATQARSDIHLETDNVWMKNAPAILAHIGLAQGPGAGRFSTAPSPNSWQLIRKLTRGERRT